MNIKTAIYDFFRLIENGVCEAVKGYKDPGKRKKVVKLMRGRTNNINFEMVKHVTEFLDIYFDNNGDFAPEGRNIRLIHFTYRELYVQYYIPYCRQALTFDHLLFRRQTFTK